MSLVLQSSGGGSVTLQEAVTASNLTITVPAVTGTMLTTASTGTVLQVVNATYGTQTGSSSSTYADTGLTATITPTSSSSKILVLANQAGMYKDGGVNRIAGVQLLRSSTVLALMEAEYGNSITAGIGGSLSICFLDSPTTTSAVTYKTQFRSTQNNGAVYVQISSAVSSITLMEISA
jgi:hypothetical protein